MINITKNIEAGFLFEELVGKFYWGIHSTKKTWAFGIHFFPKKNRLLGKRFGFEKDWYDGPIHLFTFWPFVHIYYRE